MLKGKVKIGVLVSGGGTNLGALLKARESGVLTSGEITLVVSSKPGVYALKRAEDAGVKSVVLERALLKEEWEDLLIKILQQNKIDLIILAGFTSILSEKFIKAFENRIINVHPSLIPDFCGKGFYGLRVHEEALRCGVTVTGATVHYVNEIVDGGEIIAQKTVDVLEGDTAEILQKRVMEQAEWVILPQATEQVCKQLCEQRSSEVLNERL